MAVCLGILASPFSSYLNMGFESIQTVLVGAGGASSIDFTGIDQSYKHLQLRCLLQNSATAYTQDGFINFNGDTAASYSSHSLMSEPALFYEYQHISDAQMRPFGGSIPSAYYAPYFGVFLIDILDYTNTNKYKTLKLQGGFNTAGAGRNVIGSGNWRSNSAVNRVTLICSSGNFTQYSKIGLYGSKG